MTTIYYYSGRGNSLWTAKQLAARLGGARLIRVSASADSGFAAEPGEPVGLVTPVIDFGLPISVRRFLKRLPRAQAPIFCFAAVTTGGMPAASLDQLAVLLSRKGYSLRAAALIPFRMREEDASIRTERMDILSAAVVARRDSRPRSGSAADRLLFSGALHAMARQAIPREDAKFRVSDSCDGCGICARVCPSANIAIENRRPSWRGRCEQCGACFAWCPKGAIGGSCLAARTPYRHPEIALAEMLRGA